MPLHDTCATALRISLVLAFIAACDAEDGESARCFAVSPRAGDPEWELQGMSMQGTQWQGIQYQGMEAQGMENQGIDDQGRVLGEAALRGMRLELADGSPVVLTDGRLIASGHEGAEALRDVELVATSADSRRFSLTIASVTNVDGSERIEIVAGGAPVCAPGKAGMFVAGSWDDTGDHSLTADELTYACMDGVIAKCVSWGYAPWLVGAEVHQTCTRLARADYCGDGRSWTLDGTLIDVYDALGVQTPVNDPEFSFEAAWGEDGAVCVNATRYDVTDDEGETIVPECFAVLPRCTSLADAREIGATLANESAHTPIQACQ